MLNRTGMGVVLGIALVTLCLPGSAETVKVTVVPEGDVLTVERGEETVDLRLYGVDCPDPGQPGAEQAVAFTKARVLDKEVAIETLTTDSQGKPVVRAAYGDGQDLAEQLAAAGLAWWDQQNAPKARTVKKLAAKAIVDGKGSWQQAAPLAPWEYRRSEDIEPFSYSVEPKTEPEPAPAGAEDTGDEGGETTKKLSLKGDAEYSGNQGPTVDFDNVKVDPSQLMMKHAPRIAKGEDGQALGITANDLSSLPYASQLGLRDGDIISSVNGHSIRSEADAFALVNKLKKQKNFNVRVIRNGKPVNINFNIP